MADAYRLIIQRTQSGGIGESDFAQIADLTAFAPGAAWTFTDSTQYNYGQLIGYRARWVCIADATVFSEWSTVMWARALAPIQGTTMALTFPPVTANQTKVGWGVERVPGQAVQSAYGLDMTNVVPLMTAGRAESQANRNSPSVVSDETVAYTVSGFSGDVDMRQAGAVPRVLLSGHAVDTTYGTNGIVTTAAANGVPQNYTVKLVPTTVGEKTGTLVWQAGSNVFVFAGSRMNTINFTSDKQGTEIFRASIGFSSLLFGAFPGNNNADLSITGINTVSYENSKYGPTDWGFLVGGILTDTRTVTFNANRNLQDITPGNFLTGAKSHVSDGTPVTLTTNCYWQSLTEMKQYLGVTDAQIEMFGQGKEIPGKECRWQFFPPPLANGFQHKLEFVFPNCSIMSLPIPAQNDGPFMQEIGWKPRQDLASAGFVDYAIYYTTTEDPTLWAAPQPEIGPFPSQKQFPYNNDGANVVSSATTTSIVAASDAYLNTTTDNVYNGLTLRIRTGAQKGVERLITGYVASTRTFTLASALPGAPVATDTFIVIGGYNA